MSSKCSLTDPEVRQCCCNCAFHKPTYEHCTTNPGLRKEIEKLMVARNLTNTSTCICSIQNGWACCSPEASRIYVCWPAHDAGCEMYTAKLVDPHTELITTDRINPAITQDAHAGQVDEIPALEGSVYTAFTEWSHAVANNDIRHIL